MRVNIIDPSSTEFNRGSFCYAPYLTYNGLKEAGHDVILYETFKPEDVDTILEADVHVICLWSYPQIEAAFFLLQALPFSFGKDNVYFVGYTPLIDHLGLPHIKRILGFDPLRDAAFLKTAMKTYPKYYSDFRRLLLSDCDMHLKTLQKDSLVYPLFTTYGCPNGCAFCPSTENCGRARIQLSIEETCTVLDECHILGIHYIHFTDEDFFFNIKRANAILEHIKGKGFHLIALGSALKVLRFIETYGTDILKESGIEVVEIGLETASVDISTDMGSGKDTDACLKIAEMQADLPFSIFWLVLTFFPGETLASLRDTGGFMEKYGLDIADVVGRLKTNGTTAGLGQFFQPYHGLELFEDLRGIWLTDRPIRLTPSFIPDSFLDCTIVNVTHINYDVVAPWFAVYNISPSFLQQPFIGRTIRSFFKGTAYEQRKNAIGLALLARMGIIR